MTAGRLHLAEPQPAQDRPGAPASHAEWVARQRGVDHDVQPLEAAAALSDSRSSRTIRSSWGGLGGRPMLLRDGPAHPVGCDRYGLFDDPDAIAAILR